jgi:hydrogenase maturation protease
MSATTLVAGIGNIFCRDDGFGVEVANRLANRPLPDGVRVADFGIRGVHLAYELLEGYHALVLVDAVPLAEAPGTVVVLEPETDGRLRTGEGEAPSLDAHAMSPDVVLATLAHLGGSLERIYVVGCQPACLDDGIGLSPAVEAAVEGAVQLCVSLVADIMQEPGRRAST